MILSKGEKKIIVLSWSSCFFSSNSWDDATNQSQQRLKNESTDSATDTKSSGQNDENILCTPRKFKKVLC